MKRRKVQLRLAGQTHRVVTTATDEELEHLLSIVEEKLAEVTPKGRLPAPNALLLVALSLVHDLEQERQRGEEIEARARTLLESMLERIDAALDEDDSGSEEPTALNPAP